MFAFFSIQFTKWTWFHIFKFCIFLPWKMEVWCFIFQSHQLVFDLPGIWSLIFQSYIFGRPN